MLSAATLARLAIGSFLLLVLLTTGCDQKLPTSPAPAVPSNSSADSVAAIADAPEPAAAEPTPAAAAVAVPVPPPQPMAQAVDPARLRREIERLASPEFEGRADAGARRAGEYLANRFAEFGLQPAPGLADHFQSIAFDDGQEFGRNVLAVSPGTDLADEWIILAAHYDHVGIRSGRLYPGADDNASGVSLLLEAARLLGQHPGRNRRSVLIAAFDLEETGLVGSRRFVEQPPVPLEQVKLLINIDMIGRDLGGLVKPYLFVVGSEHAPRLRDLVRAANPSESLKLGWIGADLIGPRSDHAPFAARQVPFLFFSTGEHPQYHSPGDVPELIDHEKHHRICQLILRTLETAADAEELPPWQPEPLIDLAEVETAIGVLQAVLEQPNAIPPGGPQRFLAENTLKTLQTIHSRGHISTSERTWLVGVAQLLMQFQ